MQLRKKGSVFSISPQLSGYYRQMRWYWTLSNMIKSEDCICWLAVEIRSNQLQSTKCVTYLDAIKEKESVFSISLQLSGYYWQMRWYWNLSNMIKSEDCICWLALEIRSNWLQSTEFVTYLDAIKEKESVFSISPQLSGYYWQMRWYWALFCRVKSEDCICWLALEIRSNELQSTECVTYLDAIKDKRSVFSISPQLSWYYWQIRWHWNLSNRIKSVDCICWLAVEIRSNQLQSTECVTYLDAIKDKGSLFSISPQLSGYYWQMRWYWNFSNGIKSEDCICLLAVEIRSKQRKSTKFVTFLMQLRKQEVHYQYHLNF